MDSRQQKIDFLKGVVSGTRSIVELLPGKRVTEFFDHEGEFYINNNTGEKFTEEQLKNRHKNKNGTFRTVIFEDYSKPKE